MTAKSVLAEELDEIELGRAAVAGGGGAPIARPEDDEARLSFADPKGKDVMRAAKAELCGLALSGGGIRSATFNLGVLQALAELRLLSRVDYLSTVSGGGYIGAWLTAWIHHSGGVAPVEEKLRTSVRNGEPAVKFLREHSNYLTPRTGFFGADTWSAISTYLRNLILNLTVLVGVLLAALLVPRLLLRVFERSADYRTAADAIAVALLVPAAVMTGLNLRFLNRVGEHPWRDWVSRQSTILGTIVLPALLGAYFIAISTWKPYAVGFEFTRADFLAVAACWVALLVLIASVWHARLRRHPKSGDADQPSRAIVAQAAFCAILAGLMAAGLLAVVDFTDVSQKNAAIWMTLGLPVSIGILSVTTVVDIGLMGRLVSEEVREWWGRLGGWLLIVSLAWLAFCGIALFAPLFVAMAGWKVKLPAAATWLATTAFGVLAGRSPSTDARQSNRTLEKAMSIAPYVFVIGLLIALSVLADAALRWFAGANAHVPSCDPWIDWECHWVGAAVVPFRDIAAALAGCLFVALGLSWRVDANAFSMQPLYRNRLVRCYLGASRKRNAHPFTGFDPKDDIKLTELAEATRAIRPYPLVNVALNLVKGKELAWQERKAAAFTLAPLHCGFGASSYRRTRAYAGGGLTLGDAFATSGAAASPNMGYHSNPALAFLMTIFNVRLGRWVGNPKCDKWREPGPRVGLFALLSELFGNTSEDAAFVYLSDGGHFDNLGVYELLRRRCRFMIVCDASADAEVRFDDLGSAIRKCRNDFGIDITLDTACLRLDPQSRHSSAHCAVAQVRYPDGNTGTLLYLKASLTGRETVDVLNYAAGDPSFPHQSTADQWFSESQFESYRRLGYQAATVVFEAAASKEKRPPLELVFTELRERWSPRTGVTAGTAIGHTAMLDAIMERIRANPRLAFLDAQIVPSWPELMKGAEKPPSVNLWLPEEAEARRDGFYACTSLLQLMQNVYVDLDLDVHFEHPDNRGWMNVFRHLSWCGMLRVTWALTAATYGSRFQTFCRDRLGLGVGEVHVTPAKPDELNFVERQLVPNLPGVALHAIRLRVVDPGFTASGKAPPADDRVIDFAVGFAAVVDKKLVYLRVQDHLRRMGLARQALLYLMRENFVDDMPRHSDVTDERDVDLPRSTHEDSSDWASLDRIFESVRTELHSGRNGSQRASQSGTSAGQSLSGDPELVERLAPLVATVQDGASGARPTK